MAVINVQILILTNVPSPGTVAGRVSSAANRASKANDQLDTGTVYTVNVESMVRDMRSQLIREQRWGSHASSARAKWLISSSRARAIASNYYSITPPLDPCSNQPNLLPNALTPTINHHHHHHYHHHHHHHSTRSKSTPSRASRGKYAGKKPRLPSLT